MSGRRARPSTMGSAAAGAALALLVGGVGFAVANAGCASVDTDRITEVQGPSFDEFDQQGVSRFLEVRCGSLDCHGQIGRPLRIFSDRGLRLENDAGIYSGFGGTTRQERIENYYAVVGLQPEELRRVVEEQGAFPERLLLVTKPRNDVVHKGGPVVAGGDSFGDLCMTSWLASATNKAACDAAVNLAP